MIEPVWLILLTAAVVILYGFGVWLVWQIKTWHGQHTQQQADWQERHDRADQELRALITAVTQLGQQNVEAAGKVFDLIDKLETGAIQLRPRRAKAQWKEEPHG